MTSRHLRLYLGVTAAWIAYAAITFLTPSTSSTRQFHLSPMTLALIRLSIAIPYLAAWLAGAYGATTLFSTTKTMTDKDDAAAFDRIGRGILILIAGLIATSAISALRSYLRAAGADVSALVIITNYIYVFAPLAGFAYIASGTGRLRRGTSTALPRAWVAVAALAITIFTALYVWLIFTNPTRQISTYYLPDEAIVLTIVMPFLSACVLAGVAILRLMSYCRGVTGPLRKQASLNFIYGLAGVIGASLFLQALLSLGSSRLLGLGLGLLLLIIYGFLLIQTLGYVSVALGAKKLSAAGHFITRA